MTRNGVPLKLGTDYTYDSPSHLLQVPFNGPTDLVVNNVNSVFSASTPPPGLTNGSFELGLLGWTASGNLAVSPRASQGTNCIEFNIGQLSPNGVISQSFGTVSGQSYTLAFDIGADGGTPTTPQSLLVTLQGNGALLSKTATVYGPGDSSSKYTSTNFSFVANSATTLLTFQDVSPTGLNIDLLLDNVQISAGGPVNQAPNGVITAPSTDLTITVGQSVTFAGSGTDPDNNVPLTYLWQFGTGSGLADATSQNPGAVQFNNPGTFVVTFTVSDALKLADPTPATRTITVQAPPPPGLTNGSFELGLLGWTASGNLAVSPRASQGTNCIEFNIGQLSPNGVISQSFGTVSGQSYTLAFDIGADGGTPTTPQSLLVTLQGNGALLSKTATVYGPGDSSSKYTSTNFSFVANSATTLLTFQDVSPTGLNIDLLLDNVLIVPQGTQQNSLLTNLVASPIRKPGLLSIERAGEGFRLRLAVSENGPCELQCSDDLLSWKTLLTGEASGGVAEFLIANPLGGTAFYRVTAP